MRTFVRKAADFTPKWTPQDTRVPNFKYIPDIHKTTHKTPPNLKCDFTLKSSLLTERSLMCYIFFDTETTGLPRNYKAPSSDIDNWPRIVQLSWITTDEKGNVIKQRDYIIKPSGFIISKEASKVHRVTTEYALSNGTDISVVLHAFIKDFQQSKIAVGHNIGLDKKIIGDELIRLGTMI